MPENVHPPIVGIDLEPALHWSEPSIDHAAHGKAAPAEPEGKRLLLTAVTGVALHSNGHGATIPLQGGAMSTAASDWLPFDRSLAVRQLPRPVGEICRCDRPFQGPKVA
jgi:hypothetical protein